jgi:GntR family transcriptional regulator, transcriptional repressor for pyruvate dehydrogenase complex
MSHEPEGVAMLEPSLGRRVYRQVYADLHQRVRRGDWLPGERLPSINQLARDLDVGTSSVREVLRSLQSIGMVRIEHGRGVFVADAPPAPDLAEHFQDVDTGLIYALAETRRIVEPELAALAAERATDAELAAIEQLAREMEQQVLQASDFVDPDVLFHRKIAEVARNPILFRMMEGINDLFLESRKLTSLEPGMTARAVRYHLLIADALRARDTVQTRLLMQAHMNDMVNSVLAIAPAPPRG